MSGVPRRKYRKAYASSLEASEIAQWYWSVARRSFSLVPSGIETQGSYLAYDYVEGQHPGDLDAVWHAATAELWQPVAEGGHLIHGRQQYVAYCTLLGEQLLDRTKCEAFVRVVRELLDRERHPLTRTRVVHGDMTATNVFLVRDPDDTDEEPQVVFIDPGDPRGLPCVELDESKLLMSHQGWEQWRLPKTNPASFSASPPFEVRRTHHVLYLTHCLRALRHVAKHGDHEDEAREWLTVEINSTMALLLALDDQPDDAREARDAVAAPPASRDVEKLEAAPSIPSAKPRTWFVDVDGVVLFHLGRGASLQWGRSKEKWDAIHSSPDAKRMVREARSFLDKIEARGDHIVLTTARPEVLRAATSELLYALGIVYHQLVMGVTSGTRVIVNDRKPGSHDDTAVAVTVERNVGLGSLEARI